MKTPDWVAKAKAAHIDNLTKTELSSLPLGFVLGGTLNVTATDVTINPVIANVHGKQVTKPKITNIRAMKWSIAEKISTRFYIYLDHDGKWFVDSNAPVYVEDRYGLYNPRTFTRYINSIYIDANGDYEEITESENFRTITVVTLTASGTIALTAMTKGSVIFIGDNGVLTEDNGNLFWDDTNNRLGIGTSSPNLLLDVESSTGATYMRVYDTKANGLSGYILQNDARQWLIRNNGGDGDKFQIRDVTGNAQRLTIDSSGNVGIGTTSPQEKLAVNGKAVFPKASGNGIKIDLTAPTFGFADIIGDQFSKNTGATKPTLATYNGVINSWQFAAGDEAYITYHIPHDYVKGTNIFLHIHWSHISTLVTGGTVTFKATSIYAKGHNQAAFGSPAAGTFVGTASTTRYQHILTEIQYSASSPSGLQVDTDLLEPDGVIELTFEVDVNNITSSGAVPDPFIHYVDIHYQTTGLIGTKDKVPDFYA